MTGAHRWISTAGEEVIVLPVGEPYEYNVGNPDTTLVLCLVLCSNHHGHLVGDLRTYAAVNLVPFASEEKVVR